MEIEFERHSDEDTAKLKNICNETEMILTAFKGSTKEHDGTEIALRIATLDSYLLGFERAKKIVIARLDRNFKKEDNKA